MQLRQTSAILRHFQRQTRVLAFSPQIEFCCHGALQNATRDRFLDGCSISTHPTVQGFVLVHDQAQEAGKARESTSGSESLSRKTRKCNQRAEKQPQDPHPLTPKTEKSAEDESRRAEDV